MGYTIFNMSRTFANIFIVAAVLAVLAILGGLVWANTVYVRSQPVEKNFLVPWLGARTFLQYGENPYGTEATQRAQIVYYDRLAEKGEDPLILWVPFPVELFYFPFALVTDYGLARAIWMTFLEVALGLLGYLSLRLIEWKPPRLVLALVLLFSIFWVYGAISLTISSGEAFIALAFVGFLLAFRAGQDELAGGLFLLSATAPSLMGLLAFFFLWWVFYRRRWRILSGMLMALALVLALAFLLLPNWFIPFLRGFISHIGHTSAISSINIFASWSPVAGVRLGWALAGILLLLLCVEWGAAMRNEPRHLIWTACLTVTVMPLMGVSMSSASYVVLFVPLMLLMGVLAGGNASKGRWGPAVLVLLIFFIGLWGLVAVLSVLHAAMALVEVLFLLLPMLILPSLFWVRWRFTRRSAPELSA